MFKSYYFAKFLHKMRISSFKDCKIDPTARVANCCAMVNVEMGRYSYTGNYTHITNSVIGNFCSIGDNCGIGGGIHPMNNVSTSPVFLRGRNIMRKNFSEIPYVSSEPVLIGHDVWIGDGVYIKSGVHIGTGAVIGAHAVVVHDVEPYSIVVGIPAKEIRKRFDEEIVKSLLEIKWWEWTDEMIEKKSSLFYDPKMLIEDAKLKG